MSKPIVGAPATSHSTFENVLRYTPSRAYGAYRQTHESRSKVQKICAGANAGRRKKPAITLPTSPFDHWSDT